MRRRVIATAVASLALIGCTDQELPTASKSVGPVRFTIVPPALGVTELAPGSVTDPAASLALPTYDNVLIAEFHVHGEISVQSNPNTAVQPYSGPLDGSGIFVFGVWNACYANITFSYPAQGNIGPGPCRSLPTPYFSWTDTAFAKGQGTVSRQHGVPQYTADCNYSPCHTYGGTQFVSVTPLPASLKLTRTDSLGRKGMQVTFSGSTVPNSFKNLQVPLKVLSWVWIPKSGTGQTLACTTLTTPCIATIQESGSMQLTALANGAEQVRTAWVKVWAVPRTCSGSVLRGYHPTTSAFAAIDNAHPKVPHSGIDKAAQDSTPVYSAEAGIVTWAEDAGTAGIAIIVKGSDGVQSRYYHLNRVAPGIQEGASVNPNDLLGYSGHSGHVESSNGGNGAHLHFEQWKAGAPKWVDKKNHSVSEYYIEPCTW